MTNDGLDLLEMVRRELAPAEGANRFVQLVSEGRLPSERLAAVAGEEYWIGESDRRSFLHLAARFPEPPAVDFFLGLAAVEIPARSQLRFATPLVRTRRPSRTAFAATTTVRRPEYASAIREAARPPIARLSPNANASAGCVPRPARRCRATGARSRLDR